MVATLTYLRTAPATLGRRRGVWSRARGVWEVLENTSYAKDVCFASLDGLGRFHNPTIYLFIWGFTKVMSVGERPHENSELLSLTAKHHSLYFWWGARIVSVRKPRLEWNVYNPVLISPTETPTTWLFRCEQSDSGGSASPPTDEQPDGLQLQLHQKMTAPFQTNLSPLPLFSCFFLMSEVCFQGHLESSAVENFYSISAWLRFFFQQLRRIWHSIEIIRKS